MNVTHGRYVMVLMINFPQLGANAAGAVLKLVFREAKIHDAVLFFDECESIFMDRTKGNMQVTPVISVTHIADATASYKRYGH